MANVYKNIQKTVNAAGSDVDMYESPEETTTIVKTIKLFNTHGSALDVTLKVYDATSTTDFEYDVVAVGASNGVDVLTFNNILILEAGDKLKMQCATTNVIKMTASVLQTSRQ
tara:strand:- start:8354 stop:8692 length:339 start_codon:yes stop_codon:yes gene_type:complete